MSIRDRVRKLEQQVVRDAANGDAQRREFEKANVQTFLDTLTDAELGGLERFVVTAEEEPESAEAQMLARGSDTNEIMAVVRSRMAEAEEVRNA